MVIYRLAPDTKFSSTGAGPGACRTPRYQAPVSAGATGALPVLS